jgi:endo-1,4-beta-xylanase
MAIPDEVNCEDITLREKSPFPVGTAINVDKLKYEERYWTTAIAHFNSFTPEKVLKPEFIHPRPDKFDFNEVDRLMEFCAQRNIRLHGHTLIWYKALPHWMESFKGDAAACEQMMKTHIQTVIGHCRSGVKSWDVVNEAFNDDGTLRKNVWLKKIGDSYIEKAFRFAAEADPGAQLFYNDYGLEHNGAKLQAVLKFMRSLRDKGVKVDGIGSQMHVSLLDPGIDEINDAAKAVVNAGFMLHYSELDVTLGGNGMMSGKKLREQQRVRMKDIVSGYIALPQHARFGITLWGVSDNDSWLSEVHFRANPLLFDKRYRRKPAFCGFIEGLK